MTDGIEGREGGKEKIVIFDTFGYLEKTQLDVEQIHREHFENISNSYYKETKQNKNYGNC